MRHKKAGRKLNRTASHRKALRRNMASALLEHERVITTPAKAKEVRRFVEPLITLAKRALPYKDSDEQDARSKYLHYYRQALSRLQDKKMVQKLFGEGQWRDGESLAQRYAGRPGGYTRIVRLAGSRLGMPVGGAVDEIPKFFYELGGKERSIKLTGNRLGDNAPQVVFELVEKEMPAQKEKDVTPAITVSEQRPPEENEPEEEAEA
ncbi:MAG: 50S ribosomal protein L17 [Planctomycetes bacterium]|nr:50S ribosomal protein L17 [Planctomycetota bacterium]